MPKQHPFSYEEIRNIILAEVPDIPEESLRRLINAWVSDTAISVLNDAREQKLWNDYKDAKW